MERHRLGWTGGRGILGSRAVVEFVELEVDLARVNLDAVEGLPQGLVRQSNSLDPKGVRGRRLSD